MKEETTTLLERLIEHKFPIEQLHEEAKRPAWQYVAKLIIDSERIAERAKQDWDYKTLAEWGEEDFILHGNAGWIWTRGASTINPHWQQGAQREFSMSCTRLLDQEECGICFYVRDDDRYRPANESDEAYRFMRQLRDEHDLTNVSFDKPPKWTGQLHVGRANYRAYSLFWFDNLYLSNPLYEDTKRVRREAVLKETTQAGGRTPQPLLTDQRSPKSATSSVTEWPWGTHHTELLGHLEAAASRFWVNYDPVDPSTAETNAKVSEWLQNERKVSRTMANSIASMLRADGLPTGPRR